MYPKSRKVTPPSDNLDSLAPHPLFVTFEGIDGCGKSTQLSLLSKTLTAEGVAHITTREPGGSAFAEKLRGHLLGPDGQQLAPLSRLLLMTAARKDHIERTIRPALAAGRWVLCDRFFDSTKAYQGYGEGLDLNLIDAIQDAMGLTPDLTLVFSLPVHVAQIRLQQRHSSPSLSGATPYSQPSSAAQVPQNASQTARASLNHFDTKPESFYEAVQAGFQAISEKDSKRCRVVDASSDLESVHAQVWETLTQACQDVSAKSTTPQQAPRKK